MRFKKYQGLILAGLCSLLLTGCGNSSKAYASDKTISVSDYFSLFHVAEDGTLLWIDALDENILYDNDGKEYFEVDGDDYQVQVLYSEGKMIPKKITYKGGSTSGNVFSKWQEILEEDGIDYKKIINIEQEKYITVKDVLNCYKTIDINKDNFNDYFKYEINSEEEVIYSDEEKGIFLKRPKKQKFLKYIGKEEYVKDISSVITFDGQYSYAMSLNIYDNKDALIKSENNYFYNTEEYSRIFDMSDMTSIYYPNVLEYWTYRALDDTFSQYVTKGEIEIESAKGKILVYGKLPSEENWNISKNGDRYFAIKLDDGKIVRAFESFGYIYPSDFSLQEQNIYEGFAATFSLQEQVNKTCEKIITGCKGQLEYEGLSNEDILSKYKKQYSFNFGNLKALGNYTIDDF